MHSTLAALIAFIPAAILLTITPGLDTALVLRTAATEGPRKAALAGLGIALGCLTWAALVAVGLGALLAVSTLAYTVLRWVGAAYLVWMGYRMLRHPRKAFALEAAQDGKASASFVRGVLTNLLNPKVGVFYVSFLPQFVPHGAVVAPFIMMLGAIHVGIGLVWVACLIGATRPVARWLRRPKVLQSLDRVTGGLFVAFGVALALDARRT